MPKLDRSLGGRNVPERGQAPQPAAYVSQVNEGTLAFSALPTALGGGAGERRRDLAKGWVIVFTRAAAVLCCVCITGVVSAL